MEDKLRAPESLSKVAATGVLFRLGDEKLFIAYWRDMRS